MPDPSHPSPLGAYPGDYSTALTAMNVQQLIEDLQKHPPAMRVIVSGYEGGYNDVHSIKPISICLDVNPEWYYGSHDDAEDHEGGGVETALLIGCFHA
jgi:hypothetical protein